MLGPLTALIVATTVATVAPDFVPTYCAAQVVVYATAIQTVYMEGSNQTQVEYEILRVTKSFKGDLAPGTCFAESRPGLYVIGREYFQMLGPPNWPTGSPRQPTPSPPTTDCPGGEELPVFGSKLGTAGVVKDGEVIFDYVPVQFPLAVVPMSVWEERAATSHRGPLHVDERALLDYIANLTPKDCPPAKPAP